MGFLDKIKKSIELKQNIPDDKSIKKTEKKIIELKKQSELKPTNSKILIELYTCYVEVSDTEKKIDCLKKYLKFLLMTFIHFSNLQTSI